MKKLSQTMFCHLTTSSVCITGIVRTVLTYPQTGFESTFSSWPKYLEIKSKPFQRVGSIKNGFIWTNIQLGTSIVSACLPIYRPLLSKCGWLYGRISSSYRSLLSDRRSSKNASAGGPFRHDGDRGPIRPLYNRFDGAHDDQSRLTRVTGGPSVVNENLPLHSISVRSSIEIV